MSKVVLSIPYGDFVIDAKDALTLCDILGKAERYREKYRSGGDTTHHIFTQEGTAFGFRLITDESYKMYKLAGKPED